MAKTLSNGTYFIVNRFGEPVESKPPKNTVYHCWAQGSHEGFAHKTSRLALDGQELSSGDLIELFDVTDQAWLPCIVQTEHDREHGVKWFCATLDYGQKRSLGNGDKARHGTQLKTLEHGAFDLVCADGYFSAIYTPTSHIIFTADQKSDANQIIGLLQRYGYSAA